MICQTSRRLFPFALLAAALLAGCDTTGASAPQATAAPLQTHQQAAVDCWMATEKIAKSVSLDSRADLVSKCIADKMAGRNAAAEADLKPQATTEPDAKPATLPKMAKPDKP
jgi:hypothetical protein